MAVANYGSDNVGVLLGQPAGTFAPVASYASGGFAPDSVAIADLNGDGRADLAVVNDGSNGVAVLLGRSGGTFSDAATYDCGGYDPRSVAIGDFNADGRKDLAVANYGNDTVGMLFGQPGGVFPGEAMPTYGAIGAYPYYGTGSDYPHSVTIGDLNGDGRPDMAVANAGSNSVGVLLSRPGGTFAGRGHLCLRRRCAVYSGNRGSNGDGIPEHGCPEFRAGLGGPSVGVLLGQPGGTFAPVLTYNPGGWPPMSAAIGDLNGDGHPDIAVANYGGQTVGVLLGQGDGTFATVKTYAVGNYGCYSVAIADLNGDGRANLS